MNFKLENVKEQDKVLINDKWYIVRYRNQDYYINSPENMYNSVLLSEWVDKIQDYEKYIPQIRYSGSTAYIESYIKDNSGNLIFLECIGQEDMVKSITSVLMQGRVRMNDHSVDSGHIGYFGINKAGNKRKIVGLDEGVAHAILYHSPSISDNGFSVLIGRTKEELENSFLTWLEKNQPLPFPKKYSTHIYQKLVDRKKIYNLRGYNINAVQIDTKILEDNLVDLQEVILEVCKENNLVDENFIKEEYPPFDISKIKSPYLTTKQIQKIYDTLNKMPKTYDLENIDIKPVGLKLFGPNFNIYVVEADKNPSMEQCFGYVENLSAPNCSEWGYINIPYYLEMGIDVPFMNVNRKITIGFEQDLYFEDKYITEDGEIVSKEQYKKIS